MVANAILVIYFAASDHPIRLLGQQAEARYLVQGDRVTRSLVSGGRQVFQLDLRSGDFVRGVVEQNGIDVVVQLTAPDGVSVFTQDGPNGAFGPECVAYVAAQAGRYSLVVSSLEKSSDVPSGTFEVHLEAVRTAGIADVDHETVERSLAEGQQLRLQNTTGSRAKAIELFKVALEHSEKYGLLHEQALALYGIGLTHLRGGSTREAVPYIERAAPILQELRVALYASALNALGGASDILGDPRRAQHFYGQALQYFRDTGSIAGEGIARNNIGKLYADASDWQSALGEYRSALSLFRQIRDRGREALALYNIGVTYVGLGSFDLGIDFLRQALDVRTAMQDRAGQADALTNLGRAEMLRDDTAAALGCLQRALVLRVSVGDRRTEAVTRSLIGQVQLNLGDLASARTAFEMAADLSRTVGDRREQAAAGLMLSRTYGAEGRYQEALEAARAALAVFSEVADGTGVARSLTAIADSERGLGRLDAALQAAERAMVELEGVRGRVSSADLRATYLARRYDTPKTLVDVLMALDGRHPDQGYAGRALVATERARARSLVEILHESASDVPRGAEPGLVERERQILDQIRAKSERLMPILARDRESPDAQAFLREIRALETELDEHRAAIRRTSTAYATLTQPQAIETSAIQEAMLDDDTALVEYSLGDDASYAWVVDRNSVRGIRLNPREHIERIAREVYALARERGSAGAGETTVQRTSRIDRADAALPSALRRLSDLVWVPLGDVKKHSRLLVVADGALQYIPFGMLPYRAADGTYRPLIADFEIVTAPSASVLALQREQARSRASPTAGVAVIADPVFDRADARLARASAVPVETDTGYSDTTRILEHISRPAPGAKPSAKPQSVIPRLPFTRNEADAILAAAKGQKNFRAFDFAATKEAVLGGALKDYRIIHFATHGFLDTERPTLSSIVLSLVDRNGKPRDGFLRAQELYNLDLNADLVVLSACQTGLGRSIEGEGLIGLTRGLMYAGAQRVVVSLWNVSDRATATLMGRFYREMLAAGRTPAAALRAAQLEIMKTKGWEHPYYWAPFIMQGDWR